MTGNEFKALLMPSVLVGAAAGNLAAAPLIGQGSAVWLACVFLMFVSLATPAVSFARLFLFAVLSLPMFCFWTAVHQLDRSHPVPILECSLIVLASQVAAACVVAYRRVARRGR